MEPGVEASLVYISNLSSEPHTGYLIHCAQFTYSGCSSLVSVDPPEPLVGHGMEWAAPKVLSVTVDVNCHAPDSLIC